MKREFDLKGIVPWGRLLNEYRAFFVLNDEDLARGRAVLDVGGGPSSFTAEATQRGVCATASDPIYAFTGAEIAARFEDTSAAMIEGMQRAHHRFVWERYASPEAVVAARREALARFLADYDGGKRDGRYVTGQLPRLPFEDKSFDLALCSHLLFLYSAEMDEAFHLTAIREMLRVAQEVRIFPLVNLDGAPSPHIPAVQCALIGAGFIAELIEVPFEFQKGARQMMRIRRGG